MLEKCKIAFIQPKNKTFNEYMRTMILLTRLNEKEYGFAYRFLKNKNEINRIPNTPIFEGNECHVNINMKPARSKEIGGVHTHPLLSSNFQCNFSASDIAMAKRLGETMLTCVFINDKDKKPYIYTIDREELMENQFQLPSVRSQNELVWDLYQNK